MKIIDLKKCFSIELTRNRIVVVNIINLTILVGYRIIQDKSLVMFMKGFLDLIN